MKKSLKIYTILTFLIGAQNSKGMDQKETILPRSISQCAACIEQQEKALDHVILSVIDQALNSFELNPKDMHTIIIDNDTNHISSNSESQMLLVDRQLGLPKNRDRLIYHAYLAAAVQAYKMQQRITRLKNIFSNTFGHYCAHKLCTNKAWLPLFYALGLQTGQAFFKEFASVYFFRKYLLHVDQLAFHHLVKDKQFNVIFLEIMNKFSNKIRLNHLNLDRFYDIQPSQSEAIQNMHNCLGSLGYCTLYELPSPDEYEKGIRTIVVLAKNNGTLIKKGCTRHDFFEELQVA